jgi:dolichyl-phosphate-mannose-protein mannosyltransferase
MTSGAAAMRVRGAVLSARRRGRDWWAAQPLACRITTVVLVIMIVGGSFLRIRGIGWPVFFTFDEEPFVRNTHNYLVGMPDTNDHPPLGKMLMTVGFVLFGYNSVGWRFTALCFGLQSIVIAYWLAKAVFSDPRAGWLAAAFVAGDGFFLAYSRSGLLDGILVCLVLWSMLAAATAQSWRGAITTTVLVSLAASVKWSGALTAVPAAAALFVLGRAPWWSAGLLALVPLLHALLWSLGLWITGQPNDPASLWAVMTSLFQHHVEIGPRYNALASPWYTWIALYHPIVTKLSTSGLWTKYASSAGNPVLWVATSLSVIGVPVAAGVAGIVRLARKRRPGWFDPKLMKPALILALGWLAMLAPWTVGRGRYTFFYHYLPSHGFGLILTAGLAATLERRRPYLVTAFVLCALGMAAYFTPVWGEFAMTEPAAFRRLIFVPWQP